MTNVNSNKAFSVLEMGITITIISLLIAAVLTGQNIKHRLELNQVMTDISTITSAVKQFKDIYSNNLPGDYFSARTMFGPGNTDNGNGNGYLDSNITDNNSTPKICANINNNYNETLLFWQHLQLAQLISGSYDCITTGAGGLMPTQIKYGSYLANKLQSLPASSNNAMAINRLYMQVSKPDGSGLFSTLDASSFDSKFDDGIPAITGSTIISGADGTNDSGNCIASSAYKLTNTSGTPCVLYFYLE